MHNFFSLDHSIFPFGSNVFSSTLQTRLGLPHPLVFGLIHCISDHLLDLMGNHYRHCFHGEKNRLHFMRPFKILSLPLQEMWGFMFHMSKFMSFCHHPFSLFIGQLTSCYWLMAFAPWLMLSLLISTLTYLVSCVASS